MARFFVFILVFLVVNSFVMIEEESLVVIASFIWLDAAGGVIRQMLTTELEGRGDKIKETFEWYLQAKKNLINLLIEKHQERANLSKSILGLYDVYLEKLLNGLLLNYYKNAIVLSNQERKNDLVEVGMTIVNDLSRKELQLILQSDLKNVNNYSWLNNSLLLDINKR